MGKITLQRLYEVIRYDPETGVWTWRISRPKAAAGAKAGTVRTSGYRIINIDGEFYRSARLAVFYVTGSWPVAIVDHTNLDRSDDRWVNLREADHSQNSANFPVRRTNSSGLKGIYWIEKLGKWRAQIAKNGKRYHLGLFCSKQAAHAAYCLAADRLHGEFARAA